MSSNFRYQPFVTVSRNLGGKVPIAEDVLLSHEQELYPTTSLDENCVEFEFQTDRNSYVDFMQNFLIWNWNTKEFEKEHKEESKEAAEAAETQEVDQDAPVSLVTHVINISQSIFSNMEVFINSRQIYNCRGLYARKSCISNNFKGAISEYKGVLYCGGYYCHEFPKVIMGQPCSIQFSEEVEWAQSTGFEWKHCVMTFHPLLNCYVFAFKFAGHDCSASLPIDGLSICYFTMNSQWPNVIREIGFWCFNLDNFLTLGKWPFRLADKHEVKRWDRRPNLTWKCNQKKI